MGLAEKLKSAGNDYELNCPGAPGEPLQYARNPTGFSRGVVGNNRNRSGFEISR